MIILKLKDKLKSDSTDGVLNKQTNLNDVDNAKRDATDALITLGYSKSEALKAVLESALPDMKTEQIIKQALRRLNS